MTRQTILPPWPLPRPRQHNKYSMQRAASLSKPRRGQLLRDTAAAKNNINTRAYSITRPPPALYPDWTAVRFTESVPTSTQTHTGTRSGRPRSSASEHTLSDPWFLHTTRAALHGGSAERNPLPSLPVRGRLRLLLALALLPRLRSVARRGNELPLPVATTRHIRAALPSFRRVTASMSTSHGEILG